MASNLPPLAQATSGSLGSVVSNALVFPLDTVVKRLQTTKRRRSRPALERARSAAKLGRPVGLKTGNGGYDSFIGAIRTIFSQEGLAGFYSGLSVDSLSTLLSQFIYFFAYTALRNRLQQRKQRLSPAPNPQSGKKAAAILLSPLEELGVGCLAGVVAKGIVSPLSMITVRAQTSREPRKEVIGGRPGDDAPLDPAAAKKRLDDSDSDESDAGYSSSPSAVTIAREIYNEQGLAGFWSGFQSTVILTINPAITFYCFAFLKRALIPAQHRNHPTPTQTFFCGALASAFASAVTYPLILAKTRLQFKAPTGRALYTSQVDVFRKTIARNGVSGLYQGVESKVLLGFISEGVKLLFKDRIELLIILAYRTLARQRATKAVA